MSNPIFHNIPPALKAAYFMLMTFFTGAFLVFMGMLVISFMGGSSMTAIEGVLSDVNNPSFPSITRILTTLNQLGSFIVASWFFVRVFGLDTVEKLYIRPIPLKWWIVIPVITLAASPLIDLSMRFNEMIIPEGSWIESIFKPMEESAAEMTRVLLTMDSPGMLVLNLIMLALLPAIGEELAFRGILQNQLAKATKNIHAAIWISSILFSAYHFQFYGFIPRMLLGVFFGYLVIWTGSLIPSIVAHFVNNASAVIAVYYAHLEPGFNQDILQSAEPPSTYLVMVGLVVLATGLFLLWRDSKWIDIKDRYLRWERVDFNVED